MYGLEKKSYKELWKIAKKRKMEIASDTTENEPRQHC